MISSRVQEMTGGDRGRGALPFRFSREACPNPPREGVCFVVADVAHRFVQGEWLPTRERPNACVSRVTFPVERRAPSMLLPSVPTIREPQLGAFVPLVDDEL